MLYPVIANAVRAGLERQVPATGLAIFRILLGAVVVQEIVFLFYFRHLIFDPVAYLEPASPVIHDILLVWLVFAVGLLLGYQTRLCALVNYVLWVNFVVFTPMNQEFDGGFDQLMTASGFLLIFLPSERALSLDRLRVQWADWQPARRRMLPDTVPVLCYYVTLGLSLGLLYLDSGIHKLFAPHWRNGLGAWLPAVMPYYVSPLDVSPLLNLAVLEKAVGYTILVFQFAFPILLFWKPARVPLLLLGVAFHAGITLTLNIYPFGLGMLAHYALLVPFGWWRGVGRALRRREPSLTVFFDEACPLCNRTAMTVEHFDVRGAVRFSGLQSTAGRYPALAAVPQAELLRDLYALDGFGRVYSGVDTYLQILLALGYTAPLGWLLSIPGIKYLAGLAYRKIADNRQRVVCDAACTTVPAVRPSLEGPLQGVLSRYEGNRRLQTIRVTKFLLLVLFLQINSTVHYGLLFRLGWDAPGSLLSDASNALIDLSHALLGITPHALYLHDHFAGYDHLVAITYRDGAGQERFLPFIDAEGRMVAPNWGRVHSMWANMTITAHPNVDRLTRGARKVTAFYAAELGIDLNDAMFGLKLKEIRMPNEWEPDLRRKNLSAPWRDIGTIRWREHAMSLQIDGVDFNRL